MPTRRVTIPALAQWRAWRGWTQRELATRAGVTQPTIWRIETQGVTVNWITFARLAEALGVTREMLLKEPPTGGTTMEDNRGTNSTARERRHNTS